MARAEYGGLIQRYIVLVVAVIGTIGFGWLSLEHSLWWLIGFIPCAIGVDRGPLRRLSAAPHDHAKLPDRGAHPLARL